VLRAVLQGLWSAFDIYYAVRLRCTDAVCGQVPLNHDRNVHRGCRFVSGRCVFPANNLTLSSKLQILRKEAGDQIRFIRYSLSQRHTHTHTHTQTYAIAYKHTQTISFVSRHASISHQKQPSYAIFSISEVTDYYI